MKMHVVIICALFNLMSCWASAGLLYDVHRLSRKSPEQMERLIQQKLKEAKKAGGDRSIPLREALQALLCYPRMEPVSSELVQNILLELDKLKKREYSLVSLTKEALGALQNPRAFSSTVKTSYTVYLQNFLHVFRDQLNQPDVQKVFQQVRDAQIFVSADIQKELTKLGVDHSQSPSLVANAFLSEHENQRLPASEPEEVTAPASAGTAN